MEGFRRLRTTTKATRLGWAPPFEKGGRKLFIEKFFICFGAVPLSKVGLLFSVSFYNRRKGTADSILGPLPKMLHQDS